MVVPMDNWGKDHWSLLGYLDCRCTDNGGTICGAHLRHNPNKRPAVVGSDMSAISPLVRSEGVAWKPEYGTKLARYFEVSEKYRPQHRLSDHDDIDCLEDLEEAGLIKNEGSGINPLIRFTEFGNRVANALREHKRSGRHFAQFANEWLRLKDMLTLSDEEVSKVVQKAGE